MERFREDMEALNTRPPAHEPRATESIGGMIKIVENLSKNGHTYAVDGITYFDVTSFKEFGKLSHLSSREMIALAEERGGNPHDPRQRNPLDFILCIFFYCYGSLAVIPFFIPRYFQFCIIFISISPPSAASLHNDKNCFAQLISITSDGWPSAAARFTNLPSARR